MTAKGAQDNTTPPTQASIANGGLVAVFGGAEAQTWRASLSALSTASFTLREDGGACILALKTPAGTEDIRAFPDRARAVQALEAVTAALLDDRAAAPLPARKTGFFGRLVRALLYAVAAVLILVSLVTFLQTSRTDLNPVSPMGGVPVPADEMMKE